MVDRDSWGVVAPSYEDGAGVVVASCADAMVVAASCDGSFPDANSEDPSSWWWWRQLEPSPPP